MKNYRSKSLRIYSAMDDCIWQKLGSIVIRFLGFQTGGIFHRLLHHHPSYTNHISFWLRHVFVVSLPSFQHAWFLSPLVAFWTWLLLYYTFCFSTSCIFGNSSNKGRFQGTTEQLLLLLERQWLSLFLILYTAQSSNPGQGSRHEE